MRVTIIRNDYGCPRHPRLDKIVGIGERGADTATVSTNIPREMDLFIIKQPAALRASSFPIPPILRDEPSNPTSAARASLDQRPDHGCKGVAVKIAPVRG